MLVLTRKIDEQILIGDDIKITLVRVKGNTVRIGIEAPKNIRVLRGELESRDQDAIDAAVSESTDALATVFAHPNATDDVTSAPNQAAELGTNRIADVPSEPQVLVGRFDASGNGSLRHTTPLSGFMSAT